MAYTFRTKSMIDRSQGRNLNTRTMEKDYLFASCLVMLRRLPDTAQGQLPKDGLQWTQLSHIDQDHLLQTQPWANLKEAILQLRFP